jgi:gliding motility-associated-like protein
MKIRTGIISFFLTIILSPFSAGQDITQPEAPVLEYLTVNPATGVATLSWIPSISTDVELYVVYSYRNSAAFAIDTLKDPSAVTYSDINSLARYKSVSYVVAAMDYSKNISPLSNNLSTIYLTAATDTCNNRINISWNKCINNNHPVNGYGIACSIDGATAAQVDTVSGEILNYSLNGYLTDKEYCFYITAIGNNVNVSVSNRQCTHSGIQKAPSWIELTALRIASSQITISGNYDAAGEIITFNAEKKANPTAQWEEIATGTGGGGSINLQDNNADTNTISLYRISAINNCGTAVITSEPVRNIVLYSSRDGRNINLRWNNPFPHQPADFSLWRNIGNGYEEIIGNMSDTIYTDDYSAFYPGVTAGKIFYRISAARHESPAGTTQCLSSATIQETVENIFAANAFTPDGDGQNDLFAPTLSFTPVSYEFKVFNRQGVILFNSTVPGTGWDGNYNGILMPANAYLWTLKVKTPSGKTENRSGTITILP